MSKKQKQADATGEIVGGGETGQGALSSGGGGGEKPAESKEDRFTRLAQRRMTDALKRIARVKNLSSRAQYAYTGEQVSAMCTALENAVQSVTDAFHGSPEKPTGFTF